MKIVDIRTTPLSYRCDPPYGSAGGGITRDVIDRTLTESAAGAGQRDVALSLAYERLRTRPRSAPNRRFLRHAEAIVA